VTGSGNGSNSSTAVETLTCRFELSDWLRATLDGRTGEG
jgi:hypothetical protein